MWLSGEFLGKPLITMHVNKREVTALTRAVSGEKQIYSGNLEIFPGIGKPGKFFGKYEIFLGHWAKIWYYMLSNTIYMHSDMHPVYNNIPINMCSG